MKTEEHMEDPNENWMFEADDNQWYFSAADEEESDEEEDDDNTQDSDWGTVDPFEHDGPPSPMDPSAPGSAV